MQVTIYSITSETTSKRTLSDAFSAAEANAQAVAIAQRVYLANERQATAKVKTRAEVSRTTKKVYKQKGTGGARHGSRKAPIFVGGGVTHGPDANQNWQLSLPRTQRVRALQQALALRSDVVGILTDLGVDTKTSVYGRAFRRIAPQAKTVILVLGTNERNLIRGLRNLSNVSLCTASQISSRDVVGTDLVLMTEAAARELEARFARTSAEKHQPVVPAERAKAAVKTEAVKPETKAAAKPKAATAKPKAKKATQKAA